MSKNPFKDTQDAVKRQRGNFALGIAKVMFVPESSAHQIVIQPVTATEPGTETNPAPATVSVPQKGDIALPTEGDLVVFGRFKNRQNVVLGTLYSQKSSIREYRGDERHIGDDDGSGVFIHGPFGVVPKLDADPPAAPDGAVWYRTDLDEYRGVEGGTTVRFNTTTV